MKTVETRLYSFAELSDEAQERVIQNHAESVYSDPDDFTLSECLDSLKAICEAMGTPLRDWSIGPHSRGNFAKVDDLRHPCRQCREADLDEGGIYTVAVFVSMLCRHGYARPKHFCEMEFPGICGFTGVCFDDDLAEFLFREIQSGESWRDAVNMCAEHIARIAERDLEWRASREAFLETEDGEERFTEDGEDW